MSNQSAEIQPVTVLISSVGRSVPLVRQFQRAMLPNDRLLVTDSDPLAVGAAIADNSYISPTFDDPEYGEWMLSLCKRERVTLVMSLLPEELLRLEAMRASFINIGVQLVGMPEDSLQNCIDKRQHHIICAGTGFRTPPSWNLKELDTIPSAAFPLLAKEIAGKGSRGMFHVSNKAELLALVADLTERGKDANYLLQSLLEGQEYGIDLVNNLESRPVAVFVRRKLRMRNGETDIAETVNDHSLEAAGRALASKLAHQGVVDCDVIRCDGIDYLLDVNVRFGGGYIFSQEAGANVPAAITSWLRGKIPVPAWLAPQPNIVSARTTHLERFASAKKNLAIITTGSHEIGMGHAIRQIAIAGAAQSAGHTPTLLTDSELVAAQAAKNGVRAKILHLNRNNDLSDQLELLHPTAVVIDVHEQDFPRYSWIADRWKTHLIVSRIGQGFEFFGSSIFLIGEDINCWKKECRISERGHVCTIHSGRAYLVFRDEFAHLSPHQDRNRKKKIFIAHGGSDPFNLTQRCVRSLEQSQNIFDLQIIIGPKYQHHNKLLNIIGKSKHNCELFSDVNNISNLMEQATVALISGGNIRYELCLSQTPFIAASINSEQKKFTAELTRQGIGIDIGLFSEISDQKISSAVDDLFDNSSLRSEMRQKMREIIDPFGKYRIVEKIMREEQSFKGGDL